MIGNSAQSSIAYMAFQLIVSARIARVLLPGTLCVTTPRKSILTLVLEFMTFDSTQRMALSGVHFLTMACKLWTGRSLKQS